MATSCRRRWWRSTSVSDRRCPRVEGGDRRRTRTCLAGCPPARLGHRLPRAGRQPRHGHLSRRHCRSSPRTTAAKTPSAEGCRVRVSIPLSQWADVGRRRTRTRAPLQWSIHRRVDPGRWQVPRRGGGEQHPRGVCAPRRAAGSLGLGPGRSGPPDLLSSMMARSMQNLRTRLESLHGEQPVPDHRGRG
jgi:hypothetical protein